MTNTRLQPGIFLDRDGVLNRMVYDATHGLMDSPRRPEQVEMVPGAGAFIREMKSRGYPVIVVTNQPGIVKGTLTPGELDAVNQRLAELLEADGASWDALFHCPHHPDFRAPCTCRKPAPGLLLRAAEEHGIDLAASWMIGDGLNDIQAGHAAGCRTLLVTRLKIEQIERFLELPGGAPDAIVTDLAGAVGVVSRDSG